VSEIESGLHYDPGPHTIDKTLRHHSVPEPVPLRRAAKGERPVIAGTWFRGQRLVSEEAAWRT
jgi:hypothetical protein